MFVRDIMSAIDNKTPHTPTHIHPHTHPHPHTHTHTPTPTPTHTHKGRNIKYFLKTNCDIILETYPPHTRALTRTTHLPTTHTTSDL